MKQIIHGIGKAIVKDFKDKSKIIAFADLQDVSFESSYTKEDITGGNKLAPIASFKKDSNIKVSATNATFNVEMIEYMDGATKTVGAVTLPDFKEIIIPEGATTDANPTVELDHKPIAATSVVVQGFTQADSAETVAQGKYFVDVTTKTITFAKEDIGTQVSIIYDYTSSEEAVDYSITQSSMSKPFQFEYIFPIYNDDTDITHTAVIRVYKMQTTSGFKLDAKHQSAFAPKFDAEAKDPMRVDGHMWDFYIDGVAQA